MTKLLFFIRKTSWIIRDNCNIFYKLPRFLLSMFFKTAYWLFVPIGWYWGCWWRLCCWRLCCWPKLGRCYCCCWILNGCAFTSPPDLSNWDFIDVWSVWWSELSDSNTRWPWFWIQSFLIIFHSNGNTMHLDDKSNTLYLQLLFLCLSFDFALDTPVAMHPYAAIR